MAAEVKVDWFGKKVQLKIDKSLGISMGNIAHRIEEHTKINIQEAPGASGQGLVDTGFMLNSVYSVVHRGSRGHESTYDQTNPSGQYQDRGGQSVERHIAPRRTLGHHSALIAVGADYAIYQEIEHGFFFKAIEKTAKEVNGLIEKIDNA